MALNLTPEQIRLAQQQMSNMSPEQIAAQFQNMTPAQKLQAQQMGLDPSMIDMMSKNPEMMKQAANQFKNMTPEQVKAAQEMAASQKGGANTKAMSPAAVGEQLKNEGNNLFRNQDFVGAAKKYETALEKLADCGAETQSVRDACRLNLAACLLKTGEYDRVVSACNEVLSKDAMNRKALFRRGQAYASLGRLSEAEGDLDAAFKLDPNDEVVGQHLDNVRALRASQKADADAPVQGEVPRSSTPSMESRTADQAVPETASPKPPAPKMENTEASSLSISKLKAILAAKGLDSSKAVDKADLIELVERHIQPEEIPGLLESKAATTPSKPSAAAQPAAATPTSGFKVDESKLRLASEQLASLDPSQLRAQAAAMRSMDYGTIRRMNPEMAGFSDAMIDNAITQMEMMSNNPSLMKMAAEKMKNMTPRELENLAKMQQAAAAPPASGNSHGSPSVPGVPNFSADQMRAASQQLLNMSPDQLRQQAQMMRSMPLATLRSLNPSFANLTDDQIKMSIEQMEMMASNPDMLRMAAQMAGNMSPEELQQAQAQAQGQAPSYSSPAPGVSAEQVRKMQEAAAFGDMGAQEQMAANMMKNMSGEQLQGMMRMQRDMLKSNPELYEQIKASNPMMAQMTREQLLQHLDTMAEMPPAQLERMMKMSSHVQAAYQSAAGAYSKLDQLTRGNARSVVVLFLAVVVFYVYDLMFG